MYADDATVFTEFVYTLWRLLNTKSPPYAERIAKQSLDEPLPISVAEVTNLVDELFLDDVRRTFTLPIYSIYVPVNHSKLIGISFTVKQTLSIELYPWFDFTDLSENFGYISLDSEYSIPK